MDQTTVNLIVSEFNDSLINSGIKVNHIVLFGSHVTGNLHDGSDIDLIIVSTDFIGKDLFERCNITLNAELYLRSKFIVPLDILTMTPEEYESIRSGKFFKTRIVA